MSPHSLLNRNFVLLCLCNLFFSLSFFMTLPVLPLYLTEVLGVSKAMAGVGVSLYALAALVVRPLSGPVVDSFQRKPILVVTILVYAVVSTGYIFLVPFLVFAALRFAQGAVFSLSGTSMNTVAVESIPPNKLGTGIGFFGVLTSSSMALAPMLGITLMERVSFRMVFIASSLCAAAALLMTLPARAPRREIHKKDEPLLSPGTLILKSGIVAAFSAVLTIFSYGLLTNYVSLLALERGLESLAGVFFLCLAAGMILSRVISGILLDRGLIRQVVLSGQAVVVAAFALFILSPGAAGFLFAGAGLGLGFGLVMPAFQTLLIRMADKDHVGTANSTYYLAMDLGIGMAALTGGMIADLTGLSATYALGAVLVLASMAVFVLKVGRAREL